MICDSKEINCNFDWDFIWHGFSLFCCFIFVFHFLELFLYPITLCFILITFSFDFHFNQECLCSENIILNWVSTEGNGKGIKNGVCVCVCVCLVAVQFELVVHRIYTHLLL